MGNSETETPAKNGKTPAQVQEQTHPHPYADWAAVQAYYGSGMPPPYFGSPIAPGHPPSPYMWGPQMMTPYGAHYAAIYPHGGIYAHPSVAMGTHAHGHVTVASTDITMAPPASADLPGKSAGSKDKGLIKRLKSVDGLSVSIGNGNSEKTQGVPERSTTSGNSGDSEVEGSSEGTDDNAILRRGKKRQRSEEDLLGKGSEDEALAKAIVPTGDANTSLTRPAVFTPLTTIVPGKPVVNVPSVATVPSGLDFRNLSNGKTRNLNSNMSLSPVAILSPRDGIPPEHWMQDERELKKERRKQSNRESARRSRLRKQAETEELAEKVEKLNAENAALKSELSFLSDRIAKLTRDKASLTNKDGGGIAEMGSPDSTEHEEERRPVSVENLLSRIDNSGSLTGSEDGSSPENSSSTKLHQLIETSSRSDTLTAS